MRPYRQAMGGAAAGLIATAALSAFEPLERRVLGGREPTYAPSRVAGRLLRRWLPGRSVDARRLGWALRLAYGPGIGLGFGVLRRVLPRSPWLAGLVTAGEITALELVALPAVAATPPVATWKRADLPLLAVHTSVFALALAWSHRLIRHILRAGAGGRR